MINTILFDLDDTLLDFQKAVEKSLFKTLIHYNIEPTENMILMYKEISSKLYKDFEKGLISASDRRNMRYKLLFDSLNVNHSPSEATDYYNKQLFLLCIQGKHHVLYHLRPIRHRLSPDPQSQHHRF